MKYYKLLYIFICSLALWAMSSCKPSPDDYQSEPILLFEKGTYPQVIKDGDTYYYTMPDNRRGHISLYSSTSPDSLGHSSPVTVWNTDDTGFQNIWSPELHKIGGKWYIYFEADDGNTDNHHIYVLENTTDNPLNQQWELRGPVVVNEEWNYGIHPSVFIVNGRLYMVWSGWENRRMETETQCIFIAEMSNPWTLKSERVLLSRPEYEWERQWINPDGSCSAYPIFVNENPEGYVSPDGKNVIINYSASGIWTVYSSLGMLSASTTSNLLDASSWKKSSEPLFRTGEDADYWGVSNISLVPSPDGKETLMLYQGKHYNDAGYIDNSVFLKKIDWEESLPDFDGRRK